MALEFYSGIGGLHRALRASTRSDVQVIRAYDWDQSARKVYDLNYGSGLAIRVRYAPYFRP